jgi:hypothetical protein
MQYVSSLAKKLATQSKNWNFNSENTTTKNLGETYLQPSPSTLLLIEISDK